MMTSLRLLEHMHIFAPGEYFPACHASTIERLPDGSMCAAWFAGTREQADDVAIYTARLENGVWTVPCLAADFPGVPCWNPVLFYNGEALLLFFKAGKVIPQWRTFLAESRDGGRTWTAPAELVRGDVGGRGPVKNKPIRLADGRILAPASIETAEEWYCFADLSQDNGKTWSKSAPVPMDREKRTGLGVIQPTLWQNPDGVIHMLMRSTEGCLYHSRSRDGTAWSAAEKTDIPNNNSGMDLDMLPGGRLALAYNPIAGNWAGRNIVELAISDDGGKTFYTGAVLENEPPCGTKAPEFSYPAVVARGTDLYVTYTYKRKTISYWHFAV